MARKKKQQEATVYYINTPLSYIQQPRRPSEPHPHSPLLQHRNIAANAAPSPSSNINNTSISHFPPPHALPPQYYQPYPPQFQSRSSSIPDNGLGSILMASNSMGDIDLGSSDAAFVLNSMKRSSSWRPRRSTSGSQSGMEYLAGAHGYSGLRLGSDGVMEKGELERQTVFIDRDVPERFCKVESLESDVRIDDVVGKEKEKDDEDDDDGDAVDRNIHEGVEDHGEEEVSNYPIVDDVYHGSDLIFSNGNNREKRRTELFEKYSELYKYKEFNRSRLYQKQKAQLESQIKDLSNPNDEEIGNVEIMESFKDVDEKRDYELVKVKVMRNYKRLENLKTYYIESSKVYYQAYNELNIKLESLKGYLAKQKSLLTNLDRDFTEIGSSRSNKFYSGFHENETQSTTTAATNNTHHSSDNDDSNENNDSNTNSKYDSSETDTGGTSSSTTYKRSKAKKSNSSKISKKEKQQITLNNQILSSILTGFSPLLTNKEFEIITSEDFKNRYNLPNSTKSNLSTTEPDGFSSTGATSTSNVKKRGPRVRNTDKDSTIMNKIMKGYTAPDDLKLGEVEEDLMLLKKLLKKV